MASRRQIRKWQLGRNFDALVAAAGDGSEAAVIALLEMCRNSIVKTINLKFKGKGGIWAADDVANETRIRVAKALYAGQRLNNACAWMASIARNETNRWGQKASREATKVSILDPNIADQTHASSSSSRTFEQAIVAEIADRLDREDWELFVERWVLDHTSKEIADTLGIHPGTVNRRLERIRKQAEGILRDLDGEL